MNILFLMDPLETVVANKDTTLALMVGAAKRGHTVYYLAKDGITLLDGELRFRVVPVTPQYQEPCFEALPAEVLEESQVGAVFIRTNPPFDEQYLHHTWLLERLAVPVVNSPAGIRDVNEKLWATQFTDIVPKTCVSGDPAELRAFIEAEKTVIAKPTDGFGGQSVFRISKDDSNVNVILETLTQKGKRMAILQRYVAAAEQGDKRILLLNGRILGAVNRVHAQGEHRNNFYAGGTAEATDVSERDLEIVEEIAPHLRSLGLFFVGIDVIGDYLIEVNVTSPTCLQEMNRLYGQQLEDRVIEALEQLTDET